MSPATKTLKDYKSNLRPIWCPGCGDYGILNSFFKTILDLNLTPHKIAIVSGIGCSGRFPAFCNAYGLHGVHGRALPTAIGVKLANPELTVFVISGDGDCFSIGGAHFPHAVRRNIDITLLVFDNEIYGLTKGQPSPTSPLGMKRKASPYGTVDQPLNPLALALASGCTFVARTFTSQAQAMTEVFKQAILHKGFSFVQCMSPCVTFYDTYASWKKISINLPKSHDPSDKLKAMEYALDEEHLYLGIFYQESRPSLNAEIARIQAQAQKDRPLDLSQYTQAFLC